MTPFLRKLLSLNWLLLLNMLALAIFGVIAIYSATYMRDDSISAEFWRKQASWVAVGFAAFILTSLIDYRWIRWGALPMYFAGLFFLVLTKFKGIQRRARGKLLLSAGGWGQILRRGCGHGPEGSRCSS